VTLGFNGRSISFCLAHAVPPPSLSSSATARNTTASSSCHTAWDVAAYLRDDAAERKLRGRAPLLSSSATATSTLPSRVAWDALAHLLPHDATGAVSVDCCSCTRQPWPRPRALQQPGKVALYFWITVEAKPNMYGSKDEWVSYSGVLTPILVYT
jgi:hypothetical protein